MTKMPLVQQADNEMEMRMNVCISIIFLFSYRNGTAAVRIRKKQDFHLLALIRRGNVAA